MSGRRGSRITRAVRFVPIAALSAIVVASLLARSRDPSTNKPTPTTASSTTTSSSESGPDASLRGVASDAGAAATQWWRVAHGSAKHDHRAGARGPQRVHVGFRAKVDGPVASQVTASPDESTLYVSTLAGSVIALARSDGAKRWSVALGDRVYSAPLVHEDGVIYAGTDAKKLFAISPAKGDVVFRLDLDGEADSAPVFAKDGTIVFAAGNQVHAARRGGDLAWRFAAKGKVFTSPAVTQDGLVVFGSQDHHVYGLANGTLAWSLDLGADVDGSPAIGDDGGIYIGTDRGEVVRIDAPAKGAPTIAWRTQVGGFVRGMLSIARNGDVLAGTYGPTPRVVRLGATDGVVRGAFAIRGTGAREFGIHGAPLEDEDGTLYFGAQDDAVYAIGTDGVIKWRFETGADVDGPLSLLSDGSLVVPSEDGTVTLLLP